MFWLIRAGLILLIHSIIIYLLIFISLSFFYNIINILINCPNNDNNKLSIMQLTHTLNNKTEL